MGTEAVWIPLVAAALPAIIGGIGSALASDSQSSANDAVGKAGADKLYNMQKGAQAYGAYRPQLAEAQKKALANQMAQFKPAENMLQSMYGGGITPGDPGGGGDYKPPPPPNVPPPPWTQLPPPTYPPGGPPPMDAASSAAVPSRPASNKRPSHPARRHPSVAARIAPWNHSPHHRHPRRMG